MSPGPKKIVIIFFVAFSYEWDNRRFSFPKTSRRTTKNAKSHTLKFTVWFLTVPWNVALVLGLG